MTESKVSSRDKLIAVFQQLPRLTFPKNLMPLKEDFPALSHARKPRKKSSKSFKISEPALPSKPITQKPIEAFSAAVEKASVKMEFGKTTLEEWHTNLIFAGDRVSDTNTHERMPGQAKGWPDGSAVNLSKDCANDWFNNTFCARVITGSPHKHSHALLGTRGCGKSTLLKYLIYENFSENCQKNLIFSRFELYKFQTGSWSNLGRESNAALANYISFIHARDTVMATVCEIAPQGGFRAKWPYSDKTGFEKNVAKLWRKLKGKAKQLHLPQDALTFEDFEEVIHAATVGNKELMDTLRGLSFEFREVIVATLAASKTIVTIFDGLDSLRLEDAFEETQQWKLVKRIIRNRSVHASHPFLIKSGIALNTDSIVVMRKNTAAFLEIGDELTDDQQFQSVYHVASLDGLASILAIAQRSGRLLPEANSWSEDEWKAYNSQFITIVQRTVLAIFREHGAQTPSQVVYELFDGDLRELFRFVRIVIDWTVPQMLRQKLFDTEDYWTSVRKLTAAMASERGQTLLSRRSYRIVELLLFPDGWWFENSMVEKKTKGLVHGKKKARTIENPERSEDSVVDNILNYLSSGNLKSPDEHSLLEKIRVLQLTKDVAVEEEELVRQLRERFGYEVPDFSKLIKFMMKTDLIVADYHPGRNEDLLYLKATPRGRLCIDSLLSNLAYLEHVFHRTLLPEILHKTVTDVPRSNDLFRWITQSIRNAYILLCYIKYVEDNPANGVAVANELKITPEIQTRVLESFRRMTQRMVLPPSHDDEDPTGDLDMEAVCETAWSLIHDTIAQWKVDGIKLQV